MARLTWPTEVALWITHWTALLHETNGWRLSLLLAGMLFARGRLTVASYFKSLRDFKVESVFSRHDIVPTLTEIALLPYLAIKRGY